MNDQSVFPSGIIISILIASCLDNVWTLLSEKLDVLSLGEPEGLRKLQLYHGIFTLILLPLCPASLTHKNPQRRKIVHGMRPVGRKERSIGRFFL